MPGITKSLSDTSKTIPSDVSFLATVEFDLNVFRDHLQISQRFKFKQAVSKGCAGVQQQYSRIRGKNLFSRFFVTGEQTKREYYHQATVLLYRYL